MAWRWRVLKNFLPAQVLCTNWDRGLARSEHVVGHVSAADPWLARCVRRWYRRADVRIPLPSQSVRKFLLSRHWFLNRLNVHTSFQGLLFYFPVYKPALICNRSLSLVWGTPFSRTVFILGYVLYMCRWSFTLLLVVLYYLVRNYISFDLLVCSLFRIAHLFRVIQSVHA